MSLVTLADIKVYMGITTNTEDALLSIFQESVEAAVLNFCDCVFVPTVVVNEISDGNRADVIVPKNIPINSIQGLWVDCHPDGTLGTLLVQGTDYYFDQNAITLVTRSTPNYRGNIRLDYTHGYATTPGDIKHAVYEAVKANYQRRKRNAEDIGSRSKDNESENYKGGWDTRSGLPANVAAKLQIYKVYEFPNINTAQRNS